MDRKRVRREREREIVVGGCGPVKGNESQSHGSTRACWFWNHVGYVIKDEAVASSSSNDRNT